MGPDYRLAAIGAHARAARASSRLSRRPPRAQHLLESAPSLVDWGQLSASLLPSRSPMACRLRWINREQPALSHAPWDERETRTLHMLAARHGVRARTHARARQLACSVVCRDMRLMLLLALVTPPPPAAFAVPRLATDSPRAG